VKSVLEHEPEDAFIGKIPKSVHEMPLPSFDPGVFGNEMIKQKIYSNIDPEDPTKATYAGGDIGQGSYAGTQVALTEVYSRIEQR
jgi:hypothetical protein